MQARTLISAATVVLAVAGLATAVAGALAAPHRPLAGPQFQLVNPAPSCPAKNRLGTACVDRPQIPEWTISNGGARWDHRSGGQLAWQTSYLWQVPESVTSNGARFSF